MIYIGSKVPITPKEKSIALQEIHSIFQLHSIIFSYPVWLEYYSTPLDIWACLLSHYYRNADLFRLGNPCCPGFPTENARPGQKRVPFCPGSGNRDKRSLFFMFFFSILFLFQLYFCISIKLMYWNSVCMISTNIYIYI